MDITDSPKSFRVARELLNLWLQFLNYSISAELIKEALNRKWKQPISEQMTATLMSRLNFSSRFLLHIQVLN